MDNIFIMALLLFMMEVQPLSARITTARHRHRVKKTTQAGCEPGKWIQVGSSRYWERSKCAQRRQRRPTTQGGPPSLSTINFDLILQSEEAGPKRNSSYDPNYGHEPYWKEGDWVFDPDPYPKDPQTHMCGLRCPVVYEEYGKICGRDKDWEYKTFDNYCQIRNEDCYDYYGWTALYVGECYRDLTTYENQDLRVKPYDDIKEFMNLFPNHEKYVGFCDGCSQYIDDKAYDMH